MIGMVACGHVVKTQAWVIYCAVIDSDYRLVGCRCVSYHITVSDDGRLLTLRYTVRDDNGLDETLQ